MQLNGDNYDLDICIYILFAIWIKNLLCVHVVVIVKIKDVAVYDFPSDGF